MAAPSVALPEQSLPYSSQWVSEVTPDGLIRFTFTSTNGIGTVQGARLYKGRDWWSTGGLNDPSGVVVVFSGDQLVRGTAGFWDGMRPKGGQRVLLVGMGSGLFYGDDQRGRDDPPS